MAEAADLQNINHLADAPCHDKQPREDESASWRQRSLLICTVRCLGKHPLASACFSGIASQATAGATLKTYP
jgi:hypothetical protein